MKTLQVDEKLLKAARLASGAATDADAVRIGLEALLRRAAYQELRSFLGTEKVQPDVPRRREPAARRRKLA